MNMMQMAAMEEGIAQAFEKWSFPISRPTARQVFEDGFRAGVAWAMRQAKSYTSSPAAGNMSQYPAAVEEPEEEV